LQLGSVCAVDVWIGSPKAVIIILLRKLNEDNLFFVSNCPGKQDSWQILIQ